MGVHFIMPYSFLGPHHMKLFRIFHVYSALNIATSIVRNPVPRHQGNAVSILKASDINPIRTRFSSISYGSEDSRPTLNYQMALPSSRIGNFLGFYFEALSCASLVGMHFKANNDGQLIAHFERFVNSQIKEDRIQIFLSALPHRVDVLTPPCKHKSAYLHMVKVKVNVLNQQIKLFIWTE